MLARFFETREAETLQLPRDIRFVPKYFCGVRRQDRPHHGGDRSKGRVAMFKLAL